MMYYLVYGLLYLLSLLPLRVLFILSDLFYILLYHIIGYRKDSGEQKSSDCISAEKSDAKRKKIQKQFYKNFHRQLHRDLETGIRRSKICHETFRCRYLADGAGVCEGAESYNFILGHNFNWELANIAVGFANNLYTVLISYTCR